MRRPQRWLDAISGGLVALAQREDAREQRRVAALSALFGDSMALRSNRRDLAALLAVEAHRLAPNAESESPPRWQRPGSPVWPMRSGLRS